MERDFLYKNAPLIEVIAELRWTLTPVASIPGAAIDPYFSVVSQEFQSLVATKGFLDVERLIPEAIPLELIPGQPLLRFRHKPNTWPLYQIGPGIFSCNIIPPYDGWSAFRPHLKTGIDFLWSAFEAANAKPFLERSELRYIDGFTAVHGLENDTFKFVGDHLGIEIGFRNDFINQFAADPSTIHSVLEFQFITKKPLGSYLIVKAAPGLRDDKPAVIAELRVVGIRESLPTDLDALENWMDAAQQTLHDVFERLTSDGLKGAMGPKTIL